MHISQERRDHWEWDEYSLILPWFLNSSILHIEDKITHNEHWHKVHVTSWKQHPDLTGCHLQAVILVVPSWSYSSLLQDSNVWVMQYVRDERMSVFSLYQADPPVTQT